MLPGGWSSLPKAVRESLEAQIEKVALRPGKIIFAQEDPAQNLYLVEEGQVRLYRIDESDREVTVGVVGAGDIFGEKALFGNSHYNVYAETISNTVIIIIKYNTIQHLWHEYPAFRRRILAELAKRLRDGQDFYAQLRFADILPRLAKILLKHMKPGVEGLEVNLSHRQIGYLIGANRDAVTRALGELALSGYIEINYRRLVVLEPEALKRLVGE